MQTVLEILKKTTDFFSSKGVDNPRLNAELLLGHALGLKRMDLYLQFERPLSEPDLEKIRPLVRRRGQREPLQYILGATEFSGLQLKVDRRALIPRPETELLVEKVAGLLPLPPGAVLDLGTGSGAIALALAKIFPTANVTALDSSEAALALAEENAVATALNARVSFLRSDWFSAIPAGTYFDVIVANPPYLSAAEVSETAPEVRGFEPSAALTPQGDADALTDLRRIISDAPKFLHDGGLLALETGPTQHAELLGLAKEAGFNRTSSEQDLTARDRFIFAWK